MGGYKGKKVASCSSSSATLGDLSSSLNINISWDIGSNDNTDRGPPPVGLVRKLGHKTRVSLLMLSLHQWMVNNHQVSRKRAPSTIQKKLKGAVGRRKGKKKTRARAQTRLGLPLVGGIGLSHLHQGRFA
ncbi:hypothetical protein PG988_011768 [Apiospora saccharicola]